MFILALCRYFFHSAVISSGMSIKTPGERYHKAGRLKSSCEHETLGAIYN